MMMTWDRSSRSGLRIREASVREALSPKSCGLVSLAAENGGCPGSRAVTRPVSSSTRTLECLHRTGRSEAVNAWTALEPRSVPEIPMRNWRPRASIRSCAAASASLAKTMNALGSHLGQPASNPTLSATLLIRSTTNSAASRCKFPTPTHTRRCHVAAPRLRGGAATRATKSVVASRSGRPSTTMSSSELISGSCPDCWNVAPDGAWLPRFCSAATPNALTAANNAKPAKSSDMPTYNLF